MANDTTRSTGGTATAAVAVAGPDGKEPGRIRGGRRRGVTERQRPLWLLLPGGILMTLIILIPLAMAVYISLTDLDQYTLRRWLQAPFIGLQNYGEAFSSGLGHSIWLSVSFAVISTIVTIPLGIAAALVTQNPYRGRALVRAVFLVPYVLPSFVVAEFWRTMLQPDGIVNVWLHKIGVSPALWLSGPRSYWTLILVEIWAAWPFIYLMGLPGLPRVDAPGQGAGAGEGAPRAPECRRRGPGGGRRGRRLVVAQAAAHHPSLRARTGAPGRPARDAQPHQHLPAAVRAVRGSRARQRQRPADARVRHQLPEPAVRAECGHGDRVAPAHRHPAVRLSACRPAGRRRRGRQEMTTTATTTSVVPPRSAWRPRERTSSKEAQRLLPRPLLVIITIVLCVIVAVPALYVVLASVNSDLGVASGEYWPSSFSLQSYRLIWSTANLATGLANSLIVASVVAIASAILGTITAYVLVRYTFVGRITILRGLVGLQSIPGTLMLLPVFVLYASAGNYLGIQVIGTRWGLMIAYLTSGLRFSTLVTVTYSLGLRIKQEEAARGAGASI